MKVLCVSLQVGEGASKGHLNPMTALVQHLCGNGHEVLWAGCPHALPPPDAAQAQAAGARVVGFELGDGVARVDPKELGRMARDPDLAWKAYSSFLLDPAESLIPRFKELLLAEKIEVVAADAMAYPVHIAASLLGIPCVSVCAGLKMLADDGFPGNYLYDLSPICVPREALFARHGVRRSFRLCETLSPHGNVIFAPPRLAEIGKVPEAALIAGCARPAGARGDEPGDFPYARLDAARPLLLVSLGSVHGREPLEALLERIAQAGVAAGAQVVLATEHPPSLALDRPDDVIAFPYVPQRQLLARASVLLSHGGAGAVLEAIDAGVPQIVLPLSGDQPLQACVVEALGVGCALTHGEETDTSSPSAKLTLLLQRMLRPDAPERIAAIELGAHSREHDGGAAAARFVLAAVERHLLQDDATGITPGVRALLRPTDVEGVRSAVSDAQLHGFRIAPVCTGMNWGLGSQRGRDDEVVVLSLSGLDRIRSYDALRGIVEIESGVTQAALHAYLQARGGAHRLSVTGSAAESSIVGNLLDRGITHDAPRTDSLLDLEVVLADGSVVRSNRLGAASGVAAGAGPGLNELFVQSHFGVVTAACLRLRKTPQRTGVFSVTLEDRAALGQAVDACARLVRDGWLWDASVHIANRARAESVRNGVGLSGKASAWNFGATLNGPAALVALKRRELKAVFRSFGRVRWETEASRRALALRVSADKREELERSAALFGHALGIPSDAALHSVSREGGNLDRAETGLRFLVAIVPLDCAQVLRFEDTLLAVEGFAQSCVTLNWTPGREVFEAVINIVFPRADPQAAGVAAEQTRQAQAALTRAGFPLLRYPWRDEGSDGGPGGEGHLERKLRSALDPEGIFDRGRFLG